MLSVDPALVPPRRPAARGASLSIVVPAFNEEKRLGPTLARIRDLLPAAEIVVSDDGSRDGTVALARAAGALVVGSPENRGKGSALRRGMLAAGGDRILMTDADLSTPLEDLRLLESALDGGVDFAVGSRRVPGARFERRQPWLRETLGRGFTLLSQLTLGVRVRDFTCGFKLFTRRAARELFSRLTIDRWGYDAELFFLAPRLGLSFREVGITWANDENTRVRLGRDVLRSLLDLLRIRCNAAQGLYRD
jgi:dolichyl-phosphate beta-glucosyltransferase